MERLLVRLETTADARFCRKYLITQIFLISRCWLSSRFESLNQNSGWKKKYRTKWFEFKTFSVPVMIEEHLGLQKSWFDSTSFTSPFQIDQKIKTLLPNAAAYWSLDALDERSLSYFSLRSCDLSGMLCLCYFLLSTSVSVVRKECPSPPSTQSSKGQFCLTSVAVKETEM